MTLNGIEGDGSVQSYFNEAMFEEISYQTSAINAEVSAGGVRANMIPRDGGNQFRGTMFFSAANKSLQSDNSVDAKAAGLAAPDSLNKVWDFNASEGGPIVKNRLWFFASYRDWGVYQYIANSFFKNGDQTNRRCEHPQRRRAADCAAEREEQGVGVSGSHPQVPRSRELGAGRLRDRRGSDRHPRAEAVLHDRGEVDEHGEQQAAARSWTRHQQRELHARAGAGGRRRDPAARHDSANRVRSLRRRVLLSGADSPPLRERGVVCHRLARLQAGFQYGLGVLLAPAARAGRSHSALSHHRAGAGHRPQHAAGFVSGDERRPGIYVQDSWTVGRFTINPGVRFEHFNSSIEARDVAAGRFVPGRHFDARPDLPDW